MCHAAWFVTTAHFNLPLIIVAAVCAADVLNNL